MTRQKKELMKQIDHINLYIESEEKMGAGCMPFNWLDEAYDELERIYLKLANLSHFRTIEDYMFDCCGELATLK